MPLTKTVAAMLAVLACAGAAGQQGATSKECDAKRQWGGNSHACELRETTVPTRALSIDAGPNGGIRVTGADRKDVLVQATVHAWGDTRTLREPRSVRSSSTPTMSSMPKGRRKTGATVGA